MSLTSDIIFDEVVYCSNSSDTMSEEGSLGLGIVGDIVSALKTQGLPKDFMTSDIHKRVEYIEEMFSTHESSLRIRLMRIPKSNYESSRYEELGKEEHSIQNRNKALFLYNKSIAFAEKDYKDLHSLYERRANVLAEIKLFEAAKHSLQLATKCCPSDMTKEYDKRIHDFSRPHFKHTFAEATCEFDIDLLTTIENDRKHPNVPFIANCIELQDIPNYGRGITTNCDLNPGDVVAIDRAYATVLDSTYQYRHCTNCLKENWSLIPCPDCTTAMYCNQKCLQIAWKKFHKHECGISNYLMKIFPDDYLLNFRTALQTIELFGGIDPLIEFEETPQQIDIRTFGAFNVNHDSDGKVMHYPDNWNYNSKMTTLNYHPVHELIKDVTEVPNWSIYVHISNAVYTLLIYRLFRNIFNITTDNQKRFVETFIFRHILARRIFTYGLSEARRMKKRIEYATALYPFASLINHSCAPNILLNTNGSSVTIIVLHPIKAGDQLFSSYGPHYIFTRKLQRQADLTSMWGFTCQCIACEGNYPLSKHTPRSCLPKDVTEIIFPTIFGMERLINYIKELFKFRSSHLKFYPCAEICYYEFDVKTYFSHLLRMCSGSVRRV